MDKDYIETLKSIDLRPGKVKIKENKEEILMEKEAELKEIFVQVGEVESMPSGILRDITILRLGMIAELDAVSLYEKFAQLASNKNVKKVMLDVAHEEKVHAGEFETLMEELDPKYEEAEEEGEEEVKDMLK